jgi:hypothetical protein
LGSFRILSTMLMHVFSIYVSIGEMLYFILFNSFIDWWVSGLLELLHYFVTEDS